VPTSDDCARVDELKFSAVVASSFKRHPPVRTSRRAGRKDLPLRASREHRRDGNERDMQVLPPRRVPQRRRVPVLAQHGRAQVDGVRVLPRGELRVRGQVPIRPRPPAEGAKTRVRSFLRPRPSLRAEREDLGAAGDDARGISRRRRRAARDLDAQLFFPFLSKLSSRRRNPRARRRRRPGRRLRPPRAAPVAERDS